MKWTCLEEMEGLEGTVYSLHQENAQLRATYKVGDTVL